VAAPTSNQARPRAAVQGDKLLQPEVLASLSSLELIARAAVQGFLVGLHRSPFFGFSQEFAEYRPYTEGDDPRFIDWNVSARFNHPFSKLFEEERELTVMLLVDVSASSLFGTVHARKKDLITEICAVLAFSAINNNDKVGAILFSDKIETYIPPKKGRDHVLYIVRQLLTSEPKRKGTSLNEAIRFFNRSVKHNSIAFLLSDFVEGDRTGDVRRPEERFEDALKVAGKKHDMIGIRVYDKMDMELPAIGLIEAEDSETGRRTWVDTNDYLVRTNYQQHFFNQTEQCKSIFNKAGCDLLHLRTDEDYVKILQRFFVGRHRPG